MKYIKYLFVVLLVGILAGCGPTRDIYSQGPVYVPGNAKWGIAPFSNHTGTPMANSRARAITATLLQLKGIHRLASYPLQRNCTRLLTCPYYMPSKVKIKNWARRHHIRYIVMGTVNEWRYKVGLDGEPSASVTLKVIDTRTGQIIWNAVGSRSGGSRSGLGVVGQQLIMTMLSNLVIVNS